MALTALTVFVLGSIVVALGPEKRGARFGGRSVLGREKRAGT
jgi:hypothetical protein